MLVLIRIVFIALIYEPSVDRSEPLDSALFSWSDSASRSTDDEGKKMQSPPKGTVFLQLTVMLWSSLAPGKYEHKVNMKQHDFCSVVYMCTLMMLILRGGKADLHHLRYSISVSFDTRSGESQEIPACGYMNAMAIGPIMGNVYFTDSTDIAPARRRRRPKQQQATFCSSSKMSKDGKCRKAKGRHDASWYYEYVWDTMFASKQDLMHRRTHRCLCEYNLTTDQTRVLADDIRSGAGRMDCPLATEYACLGNIRSWWTVQACFLAKVNGTNGSCIWGKKWPPWINENRLK